MEIGRKPATARPWGDADTAYVEIGGDEAVRRLTDAFYDAVESDSPTLRAMLPQNTSGSRQKLYEFLSGWMGGPQLYWERRGHPALRMRHAPFPIDSAAARQWAECMRTAIASCDIGQPLAGWLDQQLSDVAKMLRNRPD
ncbi:group II truncated hemoglobin [soil metagenome]